MRKVKDKKDMYIRCYGDTTGNILRSLGRAMQNPGQEIVIIDDAISAFPHSMRVKRNIGDKAQALITRLGLDKIKLTIKGDHLYVKSEFHGSLDMIPCGSLHDWPDATEDDWKDSEFPEVITESIDDDKLV